MKEQHGSAPDARLSSSTPVGSQDNGKASVDSAGATAVHVDASKVAKKNKFVEGLLELGRNWAVAVALAALGIASYHGEAVFGAWQNKGLIFGTIVSFSILWIGISILRFLDVVEARTKGFLQSMKAFFAVTILVSAGIGLLVLTASYADNAKIVRICNDYRSLPSSAAYNDALCQKLYKARADKERIYLGQK